MAQQTPAKPASALSPYMKAIVKVCATAQVFVDHVVPIPRTSYYDELVEAVERLHILEEVMKEIEKNG